MSYSTTTIEKTGQVCDAPIKAGAGTGKCGRRVRPGFHVHNPGRPAVIWLMCFCCKRQIGWMAGRWCPSGQRSFLLPPGCAGRDAVRRFSYLPTKSFLIAGDCSGGFCFAAAGSSRGCQCILQGLGGAGDFMDGRVNPPSNGSEDGSSTLCRRDAYAPFRAPIKEETAITFPKRHHCVIFAHGNIMKFDLN